MKDIIFNKHINSFEKKFKKLGKKLLNKLSVSQYLKTFGSYQPVSTHKEDMDLIVTSAHFANISTRRTIVNTLKAINFKREDKWTEQVAIAFMEEVIDLYLHEGDDEIIKQREVEISERYNVKVSRLKTQVALFINNLENYKDKFHIMQYFSGYEIVLWKYRDIEKLQEDVENNNLNTYDDYLLKRLDKIV